MTLTDNLSWIQDKATSSPLFSGSKVYFHVDTVQVAGGNLIRGDPKVMQNIGFLSTETGANTKHQQRMNRLKSEVGINGFDETLWTLSGVLHEPQESLFNYPSNSFTLSDDYAKYDFLLDREFTSETATTPSNTVVPMLSINRIWTLRWFPRTLYIYDPQVIKQLIRGAVSSEINSVYTYYTAYGVPVTLRSISINNNREGATVYSLTFVEDKELV
jgi:hypothetical protein